MKKIIFKSCETETSEKFPVYFINLNRIVDSLVLSRELAEQDEQNVFFNEYSTILFYYSLIVIVESGLRSCQ